MTAAPAGRRDRARLVALLALGAGTAGVLAAQHWGSATPLLLGCGLAALGLALAAGLPPEESAALPAPAALPRGRLAWSAAGVLVAAALLAAALPRFEGPRADPPFAWTLYLAALAVVLAAFLPWRGQRPASERPSASRRELAALALALALGAAFRLHRISTTPYGVWFDEAQNVLEVQRILAEPGYRPVFVPGWSQMAALPFYYDAPFVRWLGPSALSLRLGASLAGLLALVAAYWLGRQLYGPREGLLAAALLAVCRWHVDFSRFGVAQIFASLAPALVLALFWKSQRRGSPRAAVACGLALGLGLQLYYAMAVVPLLLVLTLLVRLAWARRGAAGAVLLLALTLASAAAAYAPLLQYASRHGAEYRQRFRDTSIVKAASPAELLRTFVRDTPARGEAWAALGRSALKHARMFHLEGDANGRHNLPGAPMLDPVTGLLFGVGLAWCAARAREPRSALLLLWLGAMLAPGVLSVEFEAPQGARTLGATTVVALLAALPLARVSRALDAAPGWPRRFGTTVALLLLGAAAVSAWRTFFDRQAWDPAVWAAWSTPETKIGQVVRAEGGEAEVYVPAELLGGPTEQLILGRPLEAHPFEPRRDLPLRPGGRRALVFLGGHELQAVSLLRRYYPDAALEPFGAPRPDGSQGDPILWIARVPASQVAALAGWRVQYPGQAGPPRPTLSSSWRWDDAPLAPPYRAVVRGTLRVEQDGTYGLALSGDAAARLGLDGEATLSIPGVRRRAVPLARGVHALELDVDVRRAGSQTSLTWTPPGAASEQPIPADAMFSPDVPAGGLLGAYHAGAEWRGQPAFRQIDPQVAFYFHVLPLPRPFSVRWSGRVGAAVEGVYAFATSSVGASSVRVDGRLVAADPGTEGQVLLARGWHALEVLYQARGDYSQVYLYWTPPGGARELVPQEALRPSSPGPGETAPPPEPPVAKGAAALVAARPLAASDGLRLARGPDGRLGVLSLTARRLELLSADGRSAGPAIALPGVKDPADLAVGPGGRLYVLDAGGGIQVFAPGGALERSIDLRPLGVYNPRGLAVDPLGGLVVADTGGGRVLACDPAGRLLRQLGRLGSGPGELVDPMDVAVDGAGNTVVVDSGNARVQRFGPEGRSASAWPRPGSRAGLLSPRLDADAAGAVWVAGGESDELWRLAPTDAGPAVYHLPPGPRAVGVAAGPPGRLFLLVQSPAQLLELRIP